MVSVVSCAEFSFGGVAQKSVQIVQGASVKLRFCPFQAIKGRKLHIFVFVVH